MSGQIEKIIQVYKTLAKVPSILGARLNNTGTKISSRWSIRNIDKGKNSQYMIDYMLDADLKVIAESDFGVDVSNELLSAVSPRETYKAVIREEKNGKDKKCFLEVWSRNSLAHSIDLTALDVHGDVYADAEFGSLDWSEDEKSLIYIAEQKPKKSEPYIKRKPLVDESNGSGDKKITPGEEHIYRPDWGEQLVGKKRSVIVKCDLDTEAVTVLDGIPDNMCPGQVRFSADGKGVIGVVWETNDPSRLGLIFCTNRVSHVFWLSFGGVYRRLSGRPGAVRSPRPAADGGVLWLQRAAGGPHHACQQIVKLDKSALEEIIDTELSNESKESVLLDIVRDKIDITNGSFYGMYGLSLPQKCMSEDGKRLLFSTASQTEVHSYVLDVESKNITKISLAEAGSTTILYVRNDVVVATFSNVTTPGRLYVGRLPQRGSEAAIDWRAVGGAGAAPPGLSDARVEYLHLEHPDCGDDVKSFTCILVSGAGPGAGRPLVAWPHGGPHSAFVNAYSLETAFFHLLGFASLQINYRGSIGAGDASVRFLPKRIGSADVFDCKVATDEAVKRSTVDGSRLCLYGGSHGGFLVAHLSGQFPGTYKAVVARNPVIDCSSMAGVTDIPDCTLRLNYRGSTGYGDDNVYSIVGHIGVLDVQDTLLAINTVKGNFGKIVLYGGSYGGFHAAHLAGQYPDLIAAMVLRNPLVDLASQVSYAESPDGCYIEAGLAYRESGEVLDEDLLAMRRCSPIVHAHKVTAPTALMLGSNDKRVPYYQGLDYAKRLKANGVNTRVFMYEDSHSLSSQCAEMDNLINGADWFLTHLKA